MPRVTLSGPMKMAAGGLGACDIEARTIHELLERLGEAHPKLKPHFERGVAVAVDGEIYRDDWFRPLSPDSEVVVLPRMAGG
jgi:molybdopterin synthase sulfur carrier subunit